MKERPILFNAPMVRAIIEGMKRQTRRVVKPQPSRDFIPNVGAYHRTMVNKRTGEAFPDRVIRFGASDENEDFPCPYGQPGDRLVMLTTWATEKQYDGTKPSRLPDNARIWSLWDGDTKPEWCGRLRPGRFLPGRFRHIMPRSEITDVRVERLNSISADDAGKEGCGFGVNDETGGPVARFWKLWESINGPGSWDSNPWVWAITFRRL